MTTELENVPTETLRRATFAAQREAYQEHPELPRLVGLRDLIRKELLDVFGAYERERRKWHKGEEHDEERSFEAMIERATAVASRVVRKLAIHDAVDNARCGVLRRDPGTGPSRSN